MSKHDKALWDAWIAGYDQGWDDQRDGDHPIQAWLLDEYWRWRERRRTRDA